MIRPYSSPRCDSRRKSGASVVIRSEGARTAADLPRQVAATLALIETGIQDYKTIASAAGISVQEVKRIDMSDDPLIRRLGIEGMPRGEFFHLRRKVRCPKCAAWIVLAPCVACHIEKVAPEERSADALDA